MTKKRERPVHLLAKRLAQSEQQRSEPRKCRFLDASAASGQLNGKDFDRFRHMLLPSAKSSLAPPGIRKTKQAQACLHVGPAKSKPRTLSRHRRSHFLRALPSGKEQRHHAHCLFRRSRVSTPINLPIFSGSEVSSLTYWSVKPNSDPHITAMPCCFRAVRRTALSAKNLSST